MERVNWERVRDVLLSIICVGILLWAAWSILGLFVHAIVLLLLSMAVAFLVTPLVDLLNKYIPRMFAALIVYIRDQNPEQCRRAVISGEVSDAVVDAHRIEA